MHGSIHMDVYGNLSSLAPLSATLTSLSSPLTVSLVKPSVDQSNHLASFFLSGLLTALGGICTCEVWIWNSDLWPHWALSSGAISPGPGQQPFHFRGSGVLPAVFLCPVPCLSHLEPPSVCTTQALVSISIYSTAAQAGSLTVRQWFLTALQILKFIPNVAFTQLP